MNDYVAMSVSRRLIARMQATHDRRRISVFSGPPGIGKTTAIERFCSLNPQSVFIAKVGRRNARELMVLQFALEAARRFIGAPMRKAPSTLWEVRSELFAAICSWAGVLPGPVRSGNHPIGQFERLTLVFDEAQNLSREAIEALRYWNDADRCYAPFPLGLIFVGNNEFSLSSAGGRDSVISAAVADRAAYVESLEYDDVVDDDLRLFIDAQVDIEPDALELLLGAFQSSRSPRSLRRMGDLLADLQDLTAGAPITAADVRMHLGLTG
ncbi:MAG: DNA polymerase III delta prime subunit [Pseudoalteromonas distincta]|jgi:DNA polymerase III delta prime subunit